MSNKTEYHMVQKHKTYAEYLAESKLHPITNHIAPVLARPKYSRGDSPKSRADINETHRRGMVSIDELKINKNGTISKKGLKQIRKIIYKAQEQSYGR